MEQRNNKQDLIIFEIENLLSKMSNQVNFLIRKEMPINQLDVDVLMENTRKLYDTICSIELGVEEPKVEEEPKLEEGLEFEDEFEESEIEDELDELEVEEESETVEEHTEVVEDDEESADMIWDFTIDTDTDADADTDTDSELMDSSTDRLIDSDTDTDSFQTPELVPENDVDEDEKDIVPSPITNIYSAQTEEDSGIRTYKIVRENAPTLGDRLEQSVDNSLAARLQRKPVLDLISAIGINDKFLFLNDLFGGSMEKYNKSIRSLNSFSTLLGAKTYMSELQIEFQWDCESDAYKKLADLVERRFISIHNA